MAPAVLAIRAARDQRLDIPVIVSGCAWLFLLVLVRMADLVGENEAVVNDSLGHGAATGCCARSRPGPGQHRHRRRRAPHPGRDPAAAQRRHRLYAAKSRGKGAYEVFQSLMLRPVRDRHDVQAALEGAIERRELVVRHQPIVDLHDGRVAGAEASSAGPVRTAAWCPGRVHPPGRRDRPGGRSSTGSSSARPAARWPAGPPRPGPCSCT